MSFNDAYKNMLLNRGGNVNSSDIRNSKNSINRKFKDDPSYKLATLRKRDTTIADSDLDTRIVNVDTDTSKKKIYVRPDTNIEAGDYIIYPNKTYLVLSAEDNLISPYASVTECNHLFKWMVDSTYHEAYGIGTNQTKYTLGTDSVNNSFVESDSRYAIDFSNDLNCQTISVGTRFLFNGGAWKVTQIDYVSSSDKIRSLLLGQDSINENDDTVNEIADKWKITHTYTYNVPTSFEVTKDSDYALVYSIKDETGKDVDYNLVTISTNDSSLVQLTNTNGVIAIKGLSAGIGSIKLIATLSSETKEFDIAFEVKETVVNQVNYTCEWSLGTTLKTYVASTAQCNKYINGVKQDGLVVSYEIDSIGQSLVSGNKITITQSSNSSVQIRNKSVSSTTSFTITIKDVSDGTIITNQVITLTGM